MNTSVWIASLLHTHVHVLTDSERRLAPSMTCITLVILHFLQCRTSEAESETAWGISPAAGDGLQERGGETGARETHTSTAGHTGVPSRPRPPRWALNRKKYDYHGLLINCNDVVLVSIHVLVKRHHLILKMSKFAMYTLYTISYASFHISGKRLHAVLNEM